MNSQEAKSTIHQTRSMFYIEDFISTFLCFGLLLLQSFLSYCSLSSVILCQEVCKLLVWSLGKHSLLPHVRGQVAVGLGDGCKGSLSCKADKNLL